MSVQSPTLLVMAGGTGGHIFPGLALAKNLLKKGWVIHWLGSKNGMEEQIVDQKDITLSLIAVTGVRGSGLYKKLLAPVKIIHAIYQAHKVINRVHPDVIIGMGGFASGPGGVAARLNKIPFMIHEQNAISGYTNRILARWANVIACAFPKTFKGKFSHKIQVVGNPVREDICQLRNPQQRLRRNQKQINLLIIGGSRGAQILNEIVPQSLAEMTTLYSVHHQCGRDNSHQVEQDYLKAKQQGHSIRVSDFIKDMAQVFDWADMVICRAGALTISELICVGLGAILVPYPFAVDDHQTKNAHILEQKQGAFLLPQKNLNKDSLIKVLNKIDREKLIQMGCCAFDQNAHLATTHLASLCEDLAGVKAA